MKFRHFLIFFIFLITLQISLQERSYYGLMQDGRFKFIQIIDLIHFNYSSFERFYPDTLIDPTFSNRLYPIPFEHFISPKVFSVFPWIWTLMNAPFYQLLPYPGLLTLSIIFGGLSYFYFFKIIQLLNIPKKSSQYSMIFYILCTPLLIYSSWYYEATFSSFLLYLSIYSYLNEINSKNFRNYIFLMNGFITGLHLFLRIEVGFLNGLILSIISLYFYLYDKSNKQKHLVLYSIFLFGVIITAIIHLITNKLIYNIVEPLIVYDVIGNSILGRLNNLIGYLFTYKFSILIYSPLLFSTILFIFKNYTHNSSIDLKLIKFLLLGFWSFMIIIPLIAPMNQGMDMTPRYLFPVIPLIGIFIFLRFEIINARSWKSIITILYSSIFIFFFSYLSIVTSKENAKIAKKIEPYISDYNIINNEILNNYLYNFSKKSFYLCQNKQEVTALNERIKNLKNITPKLIFQKVQDPEKIQNSDHYKKFFPNEYNEMIKSYQSFQEIFKFDNLKIHYEDNFIIIFEI
jgi:hypothetical protein